MSELPTEPFSAPPSNPVAANTIEVASLVMTVLALLLALHLGLLVGLLAGLLIYQLVRLLVPALRNMGVRPSIGKTVALSIPVIVIGFAIAFGVFKLLNLLAGGDFGGVVELLRKMAEIVDTARPRLPIWLQDYLPEDMEDFQAIAADWLRSHAGQLGLITQGFGKGLFYMLLGMIIGGIVSVQAAVGPRQPGPLARALTRRVVVLSGAFRSIVFSQVRISALNTSLTAIYLAIILPLFDVHMPFTKTLIAVTFLAGLLPVLGNLISNTVIFIVSLSLSAEVAAGSLAYLIVIHKLEYFANARIIGSRIKARAWELLLAMLVMEAAFGIPGLVAAPIYYAYIKDELTARGLI